MKNQDQAEFWDAQYNWVRFQDALDATFAPVLDLLLDRAGLRPGEAVLDIGCGTGASTRRAAALVGPSGHVTGLDISATLLDVARRQLAGTSRIDLIEADAQDCTFTRRYDAMISRFGVMFFSDTVAAFRNISKGLRPSARMVMVAWGPAAQNPYFMVPARVAQGVLGQPPKVDRTLPGPFAFEDADRVRRLCEEAGLTDARVEAVEVALTPQGDLADCADLLSMVGPANSVMRHFGGSEDDRSEIRRRLETALDPFRTDDGIRVPALINLITARAPSRPV